MSSAKLDACGQRWVASLANYDFQLFYKTGKSNVEADALSRIPRNGYHKVKSPVVKAILKSSQEIDWTDFNKDPNDIICKSSQTISEKMTTEQWKIEQANDEIIKQVIEALRAGSDKYTFSLEPV